MLGFLEIKLNLLKLSFLIIVITSSFQIVNGKTVLRLQYRQNEHRQSRIVLRKHQSLTIVTIDNSIQIYKIIDLTDSTLVVKNDYRLYTIPKSDIIYIQKDFGIFYLIGGFFGCLTGSCIINTIVNLDDGIDKTMENTAVCVTLATLSVSSFIIDNWATKYHMSKWKLVSLEKYNK